MRGMKNLNEHDWIAVDRALAPRSLAAFVKMVWRELEPANPYVHGWHIDAVCSHLEAITRGDITRLLITIPPGTMKSLMVNVFWPLWEWGPMCMPAMRYIAASHAQDLSIRDNLKMRRVLESAWYQDRWPLAFSSDQNQKTKFENAETGFRHACAIASMTGNRGDRVILDDPHTVEAALSEAARETALRVFTETIPTRLNSPENSAIVVVMQRLHEEDIAGYIIENKLGYEHLMLPMEYEPERRCVTSIGFRDPRVTEGELLFPERFPRDVVDRDKHAMGELAAAGQFQQRPAPRTGGFFDWEAFTIVNAVPKMKCVIRYWDKAGTQDGGCYTAGVKIGRGMDDKYYVLDVVRGQWSAPERERRMLAAAEEDGKKVYIWIEQEPGSGGKESAQSTIANMAGFRVKAEAPTGDKQTRAEPYSIQVEGGNVMLLEGRWNKAYIDEHKTFPRGKYKDQIDAAAGAFNKLLEKKSKRIRMAFIGPGGTCNELVIGG